MRKSWIQFIVNNKNLTLKRLASKEGEQAILIVDKSDKPKNQEDLRKGYII